MGDCSHYLRPNSICIRVILREPLCQGTNYMAIRLETENLKSCNAPFPKPASVVLNRTFLGCISHVSPPLYPVIYPVTMISARVIYRGIRVRDEQNVRRKDT